MYISNYSTQWSSGRGSGKLVHLEKLFDCGTFNHLVVGFSWLWNSKPQRKFAFQVYHGHYDSADIFRLQVGFITRIFQMVWHNLTNIPFSSSGIGFGCSSGNNAGKKGSIKFAEQVLLNMDFSERINYGWYTLNPSPFFSRLTWIITEGKWKSMIAANWDHGRRQR